MSRRVRGAYVMHALQGAGAEGRVSESIRGAQDRLDPVILCLDEIGALGEELRQEGVPVEVLGRQPGIDFTLVRRLGQALSTHQAEVVHAHQYTPFFYAAASRLVARQQGGLVFTEHGRHFPDVVSGRRRRLNRFLFARLVREINACSEFSGRALSEVDGFPADRVEVIENGIEPDLYGVERERSALRRELGWSEEARMIICVARFHPVKDHRTLVEAFSLVRSARPAAELVLVGEGPERASIEQQIHSLGLDGSVSMLGVRHDGPERLAASDIFCMTSLSEAASLTVLEAMASRLPVVVTEVGGNPEMVRSGREGLLVPRQDPAAAAQAIETLLMDDDQARAMGRAARRRVEAHYDLERTVARHLEVYDRVAAH